MKASTHIDMEPEMSTSPADLTYSIALTRIEDAQRAAAASLRAARARESSASATRPWIPRLQALHAFARTRLATSPVVSETAVCCA